MNSEYPSSQRAQRLLILGAVIGLLLAASGLLQETKTIAVQAVATVNDEIISKEDYLTYLSLLAKDKRNPLTDKDRRHVLNRMLEERLLIARGIDIGLAKSDPNIRKVIIDAMIQTVIADISSTEPEENELNDFYQNNINYFARPARIQLQRIVFRNNDYSGETHPDGNKKKALEKATAAREKLLAGENFSAIKTLLGSREILTIPNSLLPPNKLRQYIGPKLTSQAMLMNSGTFSEPIDDGSGYSILFLIANEQSTPMALDSIRDQVANEYRRRSGDQALRNYLLQLRQQADIQIDESFLASIELASQPAPEE